MGATPLTFATAQGQSQLRQEETRLLIKQQMEALIDEARIEYGPGSSVDS
jgi:hypothetical protein